MEIIGNGSKQKCATCNEIFGSKKDLKTHKNEVHSM